MQKGIDSPYNSRNHEHYYYSSSSNITSSRRKDDEDEDDDDDEEQEQEKGKEKKKNSDENRHVYVNVLVRRVPPQPFHSLCSGHRHPAPSHAPSPTVPTRQTTSEHRVRPLGGHVV